MTGPRGVTTTPKWRVIGRGPAVTTTIAALVAIVSWAPKWGDDFLLGVLYVLDVASFAATGAFLLSDRRTGRLGWGMIGAAFCYTVSWWWIWPQNWQIGPAPFVSFVFGYGWFVVGGLALVRYPEPALARRHEQVYFAALATWVFGGKLFVTTVSEPQWKHFDPDAWWPTIAADEQLFTTASTVLGTGITTLALLLPVLLLRKIRRSRPLERSDMLPATAAAVAIGVVGGLYLIAVQLHIRGHVTDALRTLTGLAALVAPTAFIVSLIQRRLALGSVVGLIAPLSRCETIQQIEAALRDALGDRTLVLAVCAGPPSTYLTPEGYPFTPADDGRWQVEVLGRSGRSIAVLLVDPTLRRREDLVRAAAVASGIALEDGALQRDLTTKLSQSQQSRQLLTENSLSELQRIGHELHDGVQSSLQAVRTHLTRTRLYLRRHQLRPEQPAQLGDVGAAVGDAQTALQQAIDDLRDLARGVYPDLLEAGLRPALQRRFHAFPVPVTMHIDDRRANRDIELMLYFLVCEGLSNILKHAGATRVTVSTTITGRTAAVRISDDGMGGAHAAPGSGLTALRERVRSLRGELTISSSPGAGTVLEAVIPCE